MKAVADNLLKAISSFFIWRKQADSPETIALRELQKADKLEKEIVANSRAFMLYFVKAYPEVVKAIRSYKSDKRTMKFKCRIAFAELLKSVTK